MHWARVANHLPTLSSQRDHKISKLPRGQMKLTNTKKQREHHPRLGKRLQAPLFLISPDSLLKEMMINKYQINQMHHPLLLQERALNTMI
mmetsp:Transcript_120759/g.210167  ORF Transcript_120759/g.210167 Transcript_120759/m.210167 type:complete len:90 (-) Transcript_120759:3289-3558(-)